MLEFFNDCIILFFVVFFIVTFTINLFIIVIIFRFPKLKEPWFWAMSFLTLTYCFLIFCFILVGSRMVNVQDLLCISKIAHTFNYMDYYKVILSNVLNAKQFSEYAIFFLALCRYLLSFYLILFLYPLTQTIEQRRIFFQVSCMALGLIGVTGGFSFFYEWYCLRFIDLILLITLSVLSITKLPCLRAKDCLWCNSYIVKKLQLLIYYFTFKEEKSDLLMVTTRYKNQYGHKIDFHFSSHFVEFILSSEYKTWRFCFSVFNISFTCCSKISLRNRVYFINLLPLYQPGLSVAVFAICAPKLPPTPDDPLYTDHEIWKKGMIEKISPETERFRALRDEAARLEAEKQAAERQEIIGAEQEWDDDLTDLTLFFMFAEILIIAINAYRRSGGGW